MSIGRRRWPKSRIIASQNSTVALKLNSQLVDQNWYSGRAERRGGKGGGKDFIRYLTMRLTRLLSISYTPSRKTSFWRRSTGPSSGSIHGHPLVARSGSVAARKMAPATRSTGVIGIPTMRDLDFQSIMLVSAQTTIIDL